MFKHRPALSVDGECWLPVLLLPPPSPLAFALTQQRSSQATPYGATGRLALQGGFFYVHGAMSKELQATCN